MWLFSTFLPGVWNGIFLIEKKSTHFGAVSIPDIEEFEIRNSWHFETAQLKFPKQIWGKLQPQKFQQSYRKGWVQKSQAPLFGCPKCWWIFPLLCHPKWCRIFFHQMYRHQLLMLESHKSPGEHKNNKHFFVGRKSWCFLWSHKYIYWINAPLKTNMKLTNLLLCS